jgi:hypothetical protein
LFEKTSCTPPILRADAFALFLLGSLQELPANEWDREHARRSAVAARAGLSLDFDARARALHARAVAPV